MAKATKKLTYTSAKDFRPVVQSLLQESDRGAVLVASAAADEALEQLLRAVLVSGADKTLFEYTGPFGTFSGKINACYGFGLLSKEDFDALHSIRKVRNKAAHVVTNQDFTVDSLKNAISALPVTGKIPKAGSAVRSRLLWATAGLVARIGNRALRMTRKTAPRAT